MTVARRVSSAITSGNVGFPSGGHAVGFSQECLGGTLVATPQKSLKARVGFSEIVQARGENCVLGYGGWQGASCDEATQFVLRRLRNDPEAIEAR